MKARVNFVLAAQMVHGHGVWSTGTGEPNRSQLALSAHSDPHGSVVAMAVLFL
jgi:hypothetical protein